MSYELNFENIIISKPVKNSLLKSVLNTDVIVPDTKPDVDQILQVNALSSIKEKYIQKDNITVSGYVDYTVLYVSDENAKEIQNIRIKVPFNQQIEADGIEEHSNNYVFSDVSHIEYRVCNSRKISVKSVISFETGIVGNTSIDSVSSISSAINVPYKEETIKFLNMSVCSENTFKIADEIKIPYIGENEPEILKVDCKIIPEEHKTMNGKAIVKGILDSDVLYSKEGDICHMENQTPFTEVIDVDNLSPNMHTEIKFGISSYECNINAYEEDAVISLETSIDFAICGYEEVEHYVLTDAYCPDYKMDIEYSELNYFKVDNSLEKTFVVSDTLDLTPSEPGFLKIYNVEAKPVVGTITPYEKYCTVEGYIDSKVLYLSDDESRLIFSAHKRIPYSYRIDEKSFTPKSQINAELTLDNLGYIIKSDRSVEIRSTLKISMMVLEENKKSIISSLNIDEDTPLSNNGKAGITIYFPDKDENLWDVAKKYLTTVEEVSKINEIETNTVLNPNYRLVIPKRVNKM